MSLEKEIHTGIVIEVRDDYTGILLKTPEGKQYKRPFKTPFLNACGIGKEGEGVEITFSQEVDNTGPKPIGRTVMEIVKTSDREEPSAERLKEIIEKANLVEVREKFSPISEAEER